MPTPSPQQQAEQDLPLNTLRPHSGGSEGACPALQGWSRTTSHSRPFQEAPSNSPGRGQPGAASASQGPLWISGPGRKQRTTHFLQPGSSGVAPFPRRPRDGTMGLKAPGQGLGHVTVTPLEHRRQATSHRHPRAVDRSEGVDSPAHRGRRRAHEAADEGGGHDVSRLCAPGRDIRETGTILSGAPRPRTAIQPPSRQAPRAGRRLRLKP